MNFLCIRKWVVFINPLKKIRDYILFISFKKVSNSPQDYYFFNLWTKFRKKMDEILQNTKKCQKSF